MLGKSRATALGVAIVTLLVACAPAAPAPTPTTAPKALASPPAAKTEAAPTAKTAATPVAKEAAKPSPLEQLVEGARKEGAVRAALTGDLGDKGSQRLIDAFNKKYNLNLKVDITLVSSMRTTVSQVQMEQRTGVVPSWDVVHATAMHVVDMLRDGLLASHDWMGTFPDMPREAVLLNGEMLLVDTTADVPAYNPNLVKPADLPRTWDDFLDPRWKGNLVLHNTSNMWARLVEGWGEERTTAYVERLARQEPVFAPAYQVVTKITSGEYPLTAHIMDAMTFVAQEQGAPIRFLEFAKEVKPKGFGATNILWIPKTAKYPNAAKLFSGFQLSLEAQKIWWEEVKRGAHFGQGPKAQWLKERDLIYNTLEFQLNEVPRLDKKYREILGLQ